MISPRGRILPAVDLVQSDGDPIGWSEGRARWRPLVTGPDAVWARALALAVPPAALGPINDGQAKARPAEAVAHALMALTDAAVRQRLGRRGTQSRSGNGRQHRRGRYPDGLREWVDALVGDLWFEASTPTLASLESDLKAWQRDAAGGAARSLPTAGATRVAAASGPVHHTESEQATTKVLDPAIRVAGRG
jgi:hypothetical protein